MTSRARVREVPAAWLVTNADLLPRPVSGRPAPRALDLACGTGRHALWLAAAGLATTALDRDAALIADLRDEAARRGLAVDGRVCDLEQAGVSLGDAAYDLVVVFRYLHRPLFDAIRRALRPGGVLVYETFTVAQAARGRPSNPAFLLEYGELSSLVAPLRVLRAREGDFDGALVASVVARADRMTSAHVSART